jgi:hypothetical protein
MGRKSTIMDHWTKPGTYGSAAPVSLCEMIQRNEPRLSANKRRKLKGGQTSSLVGAEEDDKVDNDNDYSKTFAGVATI